MSVLDFVVVLFNATLFLDVNFGAFLPFNWSELLSVVGVIFESTSIGSLVVNTFSHFFSLVISFTISVRLDSRSVFERLLSLIAIHKAII